MHQLSLADVVDRSGIDKAALSRIENGLNPNPTFATLETIARAMGAGVRYVIEERVSTELSAGFVPATRSY